MQVGVWIRVSTEDQARGESPTNHEARARMYADLKGWTVVDLYDLSGVSGKSVVDHPEAKRMFSDVQSGKIQGLIFSKLARLARNTRELLDFSDFFQKHNANLVSIEESLDTSTPAGRLLYTVIGALAQWEREEISARVAASIPIRAKQGKPTGGKGPFGYMWNENRQLVPNPTEAPLVKRAFDLFLEIGKLLTTCERLNKEGLRAKKGEFRPVTLKRLLTDTVYKGQRRANYSKSKGNKKSWVLKPEKDWVFVPVEAIVDEKVWEKANAILVKNSIKSQKPIPKEGKYLFSGLLLCPCGEKLYVNPYTGMKVPRYRCRKCHFKINDDVLEEHLLSVMKNMVIRPEDLESIRDFEAERIEKEARFALLKREIKTIDLKIDNLLELVGGKTIDRDTFSERFLPLKERKAQMQEELPRLQAEIDFAKTTHLSKTYLLDRATNFSAMWPLLSEEAKRKLVQELVDRIEIGQETLHFFFSYTPPYYQLVKDTHNLRGSWPPPA